MTDQRHVRAEGLNSCQEPGDGELAHDGRQGQEGARKQRHSQVGEDDLKKDGDPTGAQPRDGMKVLTKIGVSPEADDPYNTAVFTNKPSAKAVTDAAGFKIAAYHRLKTLMDIQSALAGGSGVVMGFKVYESFESDSVAKTGRWFNLFSVKCGEPTHFTKKNETQSVLLRIYNQES